MFILPDGQPISLDTLFTLNGVSYPANWLRLATPDERAAIGITEVPDPPTYDQRFYWGYDADGNLIPKDHTQLVDNWTDTTRQTANTLLFPTDWMVVREADNGTVVPSGIREWRQEIRTYCEAKVLAIDTTTTTLELADYITYVSPSGGAPTDYNYWPVYTQPSGVA